MKIEGTVCGGCGKASQIEEDVFEIRRLASGVDLVRGTLNIHVGDWNRLIQTVEALGSPHITCDSCNPILGPFGFWRVRFGISGSATVFDAFITRSVRSRAKYLEVMGAVRFRSHGFADGMPVVLTVVAGGPPTKP